MTSQTTIDTPPTTGNEHRVLAHGVLVDGFGERDLP
jgi:hypothetical protein